jgi:hypothetical protein
VAHVAIPKDECGVGLDHLEGVFAFAGLGHCVVLMLDCGQYWLRWVLVEVRRKTHDLILVRGGVEVNIAPITCYVDMLALLARSDLSMRSMISRPNAVICVLGEYAVDGDVVVEFRWVAGSMEQQVE